MSLKSSVDWDAFADFADGDFKLSAEDERNLRSALQAMAEVVRLEFNKMSPDAAAHFAREYFAMSVAEFEAHMQQFETEITEICRRGAA